MSFRRLTQPVLWGIYKAALFVCKVKTGAARVFSQFCSHWSLRFPKASSIFHGMVNSDNTCWSGEWEAVGISDMNTPQTDIVRGGILSLLFTAAINRSANYQLWLCPQCKTGREMIWPRHHVRRAEIWWCYSLYFKITNHNGRPNW